MTAMMAISFQLAACGPFITNVYLDTGDDETGSDGAQIASTDDATSESATSGADGDTTDSGTGTSSDIDTGSTTGPIQECILPHDDSWCADQREVATEIGCKTMIDPWSCYQTVTAQYTEGDPALVQASDCDTAIDGPSCMDAWVACNNASGSSTCELLDPATGSLCQILAEADGIDFAHSMETCAAIIEYYGQS